jgi:hypothetical protein
MVGMTPHAQLAGQRLALGSGEVGQLLALAQDAQRLVGNLLAERREADDPPRALDQGDAEQRLQLPQARRQGRLRDEAGLGRLAEVAVLPKRDQILQLLQRGQMNSHWLIRLDQSGIIALSD